MTPALGAVSRTAIATAAVRARETSRPDRLFDDPYAAAFVAALGGAARGLDGPAGERRRALAFHVVMRTRFYDEWLHAAVAAGVRQIILVGAGLDTRAYRLAWPPGVTLVEVDLAAVHTAKQQVLDERGARPRCSRAVLAADVRSAWTHRLGAHGIVAESPSAWLVEGLLAYLDEREASRLLASITRASVPGSRIALERGDGSARAAGRAEPGSIESLWRGGLGGRAERWLAAHGWRTERHALAAAAARYGRPVPARMTSGFVTGVYNP